MNNRSFTKGHTWDILIIGICAGVFLLFLYLVLRDPRQDFAYDYHAFLVIMHHNFPVMIYQHGPINRWIQEHGLTPHPSVGFTYPPQFAVLLAWMTWIPFRTASVLWSLVATIGYLCNVWLLYRLIQPKLGRWGTRLFILSATVNLPFWWDLLIGNTNWLVLLLLTGTLYTTYRMKKGAWGGVVIALAVMVKVTPILFFGILTVQQKWKAVIAGGVTLIGGTLITAWAAGWHIIWYYVTHIQTLADVAMEKGPAPYNSSFKGVLLHWKQVGILHIGSTGVHEAFDIYLLVMALIIVITLFIKRKGDTDKRADWSHITIGLLSILLLSPLIEGPHLIVAWLVMWLLWGNWKDDDPRWSVHKVVLVVLWGGAALNLTLLGWIFRSWIPTINFYMLIGLLVQILIVLLQKNRQSENNTHLPEVR